MSLPSLPAKVPSSDALQLAAERVIPNAEIIVKRVKGGYTGLVAMKPIAFYSKRTPIPNPGGIIRLKYRLDTTHAPPSAP